MIQPIEKQAIDPRGAIIGCDSKLIGATTPDGAKALEENTWNRWKPSGTFTEKFQLQTPSDISYIAIAAHNLSGETVIISTATSVGGAMTAIESVSFTDNRPFMLILDNPTTIAEIIISGTLSVQKEIGVVYAGEILQMPLPIYGGHSPINYSQKTEYETVISETGQFLGRTVKRKGLESSFTWQFIDPTWYREQFFPFQQRAVTTPFFIKWRPDLRENEVAFGFTTGDIEVSNMGGGHQLMSISMSMRAHSDV